MAFIVPIYLMFNYVGLIDSLAALIIIRLMPSGISAALQRFIDRRSRFA